MASRRIELREHDHDDDEIQSSQDLGMDLIKHAQETMTAVSLCSVALLTASLLS